jgi:hypothetical protein
MAWFDDESGLRGSDNDEEYHGRAGDQHKERFLRHDA